MAFLNLLLVSCIFLHLLLVSALSDDGVSRIKVKYNGRNSPRCLTGNRTACQSLDYVFKNLNKVQAETVLVSIASPQVITVKSTATSAGTTALTLLGANEDSSSRSNMVSINFNSIQFNFPSVTLTLQGLEIVDSVSLMFNGNVDILIDDCSLTRVDSLKTTSDFGQAPPTHPRLTLNNTLVHDTKFDPKGFLYYTPSNDGADVNYYLSIYLYNTNFTKNTGKILTMATNTAWGFSGEVQVANCTFAENINADIDIKLSTALVYSLNFNFVNTTFNDNTNLSIIVSLTSTGGWLGVDLLGLHISNNTNMTVQSGGNVLSGSVHLRDSVITENEGLIMAMNTSLVVGGRPSVTVQVFNVQFSENKRWLLDVNPQSTLDIANCTFAP